jgi:hypothetical protein
MSNSNRRTNGSGNGRHNEPANEHKGQARKAHNRVVEESNPPAEGTTRARITEAPSTVGQQPAVMREQITREAEAITADAATAEAAQQLKAVTDEATQQATDVKEVAEEQLSEVQQAVADLQSEVQRATAEVSDEVASGVQAVTEQAKQAASQVAAEAARAASTVVEVAKHEANSAVEARVAEAKTVAAGGLHTAAETIRQRQVLPQAAVVDHTASQVDKMADYLEQRDISEMKHDFEALVREYPIASVMVAFLVGWFLAGLFSKE